MKITIFIKTVSERKSSSNIISITKIQKFVIIFQNIEIIDIFVEIFEELYYQLIKNKFRRN